MIQVIFVLKIILKKMELKIILCFNQSLDIDYTHDISAWKSNRLSDESCKI